jgi:hypothetical protein
MVDLDVSLEAFGFRGSSVEHLFVDIANEADSDGVGHLNHLVLTQLTEGSNDHPRNQIEHPDSYHAVEGQIQQPPPA